MGLSKDGKRFDESLAESKEAMTWRNLLVAFVMRQNI